MDYTKKEIYQTLEDRDNPKYIETHGPFICNNKSAWLGPGYYFWESFIENAHFWGHVYNNRYVICQASYNFCEERCFNLIDNPDHLKMFNETKLLLAEKGLATEKTTVARIIVYLKDILKIFAFEACRVYGVNSKSGSSNYSNRTFFNFKRENQYLDSIPAIQVCFYSKNYITLKDYKIVYPEEYIDGYLI